jgi:hypothetical protein
MTESTNPREVIGGNLTPDYAKIEGVRLADEYQGFKNTLQELRAEAEASPPVVESDDVALIKGGIIKRFRDLYSRIENTREVEKEPYLRRGNAVDAFFNGLKKLIQPESKNERRTSPGFIDVLQGQIDEWQDRKEAAERKRLENERLENERIAREAREKLEREEKEAKRLADEAQAKIDEANRARAPQQIEKKVEVASVASTAASQQAGVVAGAQLELARAEEKVEEAYIATLAKPADIVRTRGVTEQGAGVTLTKARESYAYVTDREKLDKVALFDVLTDADVEKALTKWARSTGFNKPMDGASVGWKTKGVTR